MFRVVCLGLCISLSPITMAASIFLAGDSTMSIKAENRRPETGWGEILATRVTSENKLINLAVNGRSTRSFLAQGRWQALLDQLQAGDLAIIQFGHNDQKIIDPKRFTDPWRDYRWNLETYIADVRAKGATPLLLNSITRRSFEDGVLKNTHAPYDDVARQVASQTGVAFIDMTALSSDWIDITGEEISVQYYLHVPVGHPNYPEGKTDNTHLNPQGAAAICDIFLAALAEQYPDLRALFTD